MNNFETRWTAREAGDLVKLARAGYPKRDIAERLGRSLRAIQRRCTKLGLIKRRTSKVKVLPATPVPPPIPTIRIAKQDVAYWFDKGWRFVDFDGEICIFGWPHRAPMQADVREAA